MKLINTKIAGLKLIKSQIFKDKRGYLRETFRNKLIKKEFIFDVMSFSKKGVLRGLHIQTEKSQAKIITVTRGKVLDVAVDLRKKSKTFGKYFSTYLSDKENSSLLIPKGFAHGFCALTDEVIVHYKCSAYRDKNSEINILWNDKDLKIKWPLKKKILSKKDKNALSFNNYQKKYLK